MQFLLTCALVLFFIRAIRSKDLVEMVFGLVVLILWALHCLGFIPIPHCFGG